MKYSEQIAKHYREVIFGGNWTFSNFKDQLHDINWKEATTSVYALNSIATLVYHCHYYVQAVTKVLEGEALVAKDKLSFDHPPVENETDWNSLLENMWNEANVFANLIAKIPDEQLKNIFTDQKYGIYYRNLHGIIEHAHYHLGQIAIIKKVLRSQQKQ